MVCSAASSGNVLSLGLKFCYWGYLFIPSSCFLYRDTTDEVKRRTSEANKMLKTWKKCYFEVRGKIEASGRDQRWEFDRRKLFERTDYMSNICQDLYNVAQVCK